MQPHSAGVPRDKATAREHLAANVAAAAAAGGADPGHWDLHHTALHPGAPGDFTPYRAPDAAEHAVSPLGEWIEVLAGILGPDHAHAIAQRGLEAGQ